MTPICHKHQRFFAVRRFLFRGRAVVNYCPECTDEILAKVTKIKRERRAEGRPLGRQVPAVAVFMPD